MILDKQAQIDTNISLNHHIEIWSPDAVSCDEAGALIEEPVKVTDEWALVVPYRGTEYAHGERILASTVYKVTLRWRPDIDQTMAIVWEGRTLRINAVLNLQGRNQYLEIVATEDYKGLV